MSQSPPLLLSVRHDSWIRQQVRDLVLHLEAPLESAELIQAALISMVRATVHFDWHNPRWEGQSTERDAAFSTYARDLIKADLIDEVRQMTHLNRLHRRQWALVKLARERVELRLRAQGRPREATTEEVSVLTGLSVTEVDALTRMARLGPWRPEQGSHHLMELRTMKNTSPAQLKQARDDTRALMIQLAALLQHGPESRRRLLRSEFGVEFESEGPTQKTKRPPPQWRRWLDRFMGIGLDRRSQAPAAGLTDAEELLPRRLGQLLHQSAADHGR